MFAGFIADTHVFIVGLYERLSKTCIFPMSFGLSGVPLPELGLRKTRHRFTDDAQATQVCAESGQIAEIGPESDLGAWPTPSPT